MGFHLVHAPPLTRLVDWEGFHRLTVVVKLGQDTLVSPGHHRTRRVAVILKQEGGINVSPGDGTLYPLT